MQSRNALAFVRPGLRGYRGLSRGLREDRFGVLTPPRRPPANLPTGFRREPLAGRITERSSVLGMMHIGETAARQPMLVERVFMRLADRGPGQGCLLRVHAAQLRRPT